MTAPPFDGPDTPRALDALSPALLDELPYGVIRLSASGEVVHFNTFEARQSGFTRPAVGKGFFTAIAPCMATPAIRGRIEAAERAGDLDVEVGHTGDFGDPCRELRIRICSAQGGGTWLLLQREG